MIKVSNPIRKGFYPDPSICRAGDKFYLVNSTFTYFPGVPIFESKDLAHWKQIGNILDRKEQLPLDNTEHSEGIYAPTIRYHEGTFYMITTNISRGGNFIVTATDPAGPWSDPFYLGYENAQGIDPSLFFDEDGKCYYIGTRGNSNGSKYFGDNEIWVQELDLKQMKLIGESHAIWNGALVQSIWAEGPHLYKKDGYYYLMNAEGGTGPNHAITCARSKNIYGPYTNNQNNPIITHRHLGKNYPVQYAGHGDLVEAKNGEWYMIMLASRPCEGKSSLGRETFLAKVTWEEDWPVVNEGVGHIEDEVEVNLEPVYSMPLPCTYHFMNKKLEPSFMMLRNPKEEDYSLSERKGYLRLNYSPVTMKEKESPTYVGVRQQHFDYMVETMMETNSEKLTEEAGLVILQSNQYHIRFVINQSKEQSLAQVILCQNLKDSVIATVEIPNGNYVMKIVNHGMKAAFYVNVADREYEIASNVDVSSLTTEVAGGFVGCTIGMYASSNGEESSSSAYYQWFTYQEINS